MNSKALNHLIEKLRFPQLANVNQAAYNKKRLENVIEAKQSRPEFLPLQNVLPASIQTLPVSAQTETLEHDVIVFGGITDGESRRANIYIQRKDRSLVDLGDEANAQLSLDALVGKSVASAGYAGIAKFLSPFILRERKTITLEIYQDTAIADTVSTVFTGLRIFTPQHAEGQLSAEQTKEVLETINLYDCPQNRYMVCPVVFDVNGTARAETPRKDEPVLIYGFRTTFTDAKINLGLSSSNSFARESFPIWALANEPNNANGLFTRLVQPIYVPRNKQLYFTLENTIDGVNFATDGQIEILAKTP